MRVLKISFMILILIGFFAAIQASAEASSHKTVLAPPSNHRSMGSPHSAPSQRNLQSGTGKTVLPYPQGYTSRHYYPYHNYYGYPYHSFNSFGFGYYPYLSYGFWPWYYGYGYYNPYSYSPYYGGGYGYGYSSPYYRGGYYGYGELRIEVKPKTAKVYVDGDYVGVVDDFDGWWQRLKLEPGKHRIVIREGGYVPYAQTVRILPGDDTHVKALMQPGRDQISDEEMRLPPGERDRDRYGHDRDYRDRGYDHERQPYGDDRYRDRGNDRDDQYQDRNNDHDNDRDNDYSDQDSDNDHSEMEMNHDRDHQPERDRDYASNDQRRGEDNRNNKNFTVQVEPHDATIYIDGNYYGTADVNSSGQVQVLLPEGTHKLEVVRPGYESFNQDITVNDRDNKLVVQLHKK